MPSPKKTRQYRSTYTPSDILKAVHDLNTNKSTFNKVCLKYQIPKPTLKRHLDGKILRGTTNKNSNGRLPVFSSLIETQLSEHLRWLDDHFFGLSITQVCKLAYDIAEKNHIPHPFNTDKKMAGKKWFYNFRARHPELTIRTPERTSMARIKGFNRDSVNKFFDIYEKLVEKHGFTAVTTYNMNESGFTTVPKKSSKVVSTKGKRRVGAITSGKRGVNTTFVCCMNGIGSFVPPMIIYKRAKMHPSLGKNCPVNSLISVSESGYINSELFVQWLQHFIDHVRPTADHKVLLILDGHTSHSLNLRAITLARENHVTLLQLPAHTTHRLQPLDVGVFGPLQKFYDEELAKYMRNHVGQVTVYDFSEIFAAAYSRVATMQHAMKAFEGSGIWPINPHIFSDADFLPSSLVNCISNPSDILKVNSSNDRNPSNADAQIFVDTDSSNLAANSPTVDVNTSNIVQNLLTTTHDSPNPGSITTKSSNSLEVPIEKLSPLPVPSEKIAKRMKKPAQPTAVLTESPYKNELSRKLHDKSEKIRGAEERKLKRKLKFPQEKKKKKTGKITKNTRLNKKKIASTGDDEPVKENNEITVGDFAFVTWPLRGSQKLYIVRMLRIKHLI